MALGMQTYWIEPIESPKRLREEQSRRGMQERKMKGEEKEAYERLLREELEERIVTKVRYQDVGYINPTGVVPKP